MKTSFYEISKMVTEVFKNYIILMKMLRGLMQNEKIILKMHGWMKNVMYTWRTTLDAWI